MENLELMETDLSKMSKEDREEILAGFSDETIPAYFTVILTLRGMAGSLLAENNIAGAEALLDAAEAFEIGVDEVMKYREAHGDEQA